MSKQRRNIIIIAVVIVLLAVGIVILNVPDFSENGETENTAETNSYTLYSKDVSDILSVTVTNGSGTLEIKKTDGEWTINGMGAGDIDSSKAGSLVNAAANITSKNKIEENASDFTQYGLDEPSVTVTVKCKDGAEDTLYVGSMSPTLGEYFIRLNGEATVYTLYSYKTDTFNQPLSYYEDFNRFSVNIDDITGIKIERGSEAIELRIADDISKTTNNVWELVSPYESSANDEYIDTVILPALENLKFNSPVTDGGKYGTDSPAAVVTVTIKPYDSASGKYGAEYTEQFAIGKTDGGSAYVEYNGKIYKTAKEDIAEFLEVSAFNVLNKLQALVNINEVNSFIVTAGGREDTVEIERDGDGNMTFKANSKDIDAKASRSAYQSMISLAVDGEYNGEALGDTELRIDYYGNDDVTIEFKSINDLSCAVVRNGKAEFTIKKNKLNEFKEVWREYIEGGN